MGLERHRAESDAYGSKVGRSGRHDRVLGIKVGPPSWGAILSLTKDVIIRSQGRASVLAFRDWRLMAGLCLLSPARMLLDIRGKSAMCRAAGYAKTDSNWRLLSLKLVQDTATVVERKGLLLPRAAARALLIVP